MPYPTVSKQEYFQSILTALKDYPELEEHIDKNLLKKLDLLAWDIRDTAIEKSRENEAK